MKRIALAGMLTATLSTPVLAEGIVSPATNKLLPGQSELALYSSGINLDRRARKVSDSTDGLKAVASSFQFAALGKRAVNDKIVIGGGLSYDRGSIADVESSGSSSAKTTTVLPTTTKISAHVEYWRTEQLGNNFELTLERISAGKMVSNTDSEPYSSRKTSNFTFASDAFFVQNIDAKTNVTYEGGSKMVIESTSSSELGSDEGFSVLYVGFSVGAEGRHFLTDNFALAGKVEATYLHGLSVTEDGMAVNTGDASFSGTNFETQLGFAYRF